MTSELFGREDEIAALRGLLAESGSRLITVTGAPGVGKTALVRFAIGDRPGTPFVVLSKCGERAPSGQGSGPEGVTCASLDPVDVGPEAELVVLDGCEDPQAGRRLVSGLFDGRAGLTVIVTSRRCLRVAGEHRIVLAPLEVPAAKASREELLASPAVRLYVDRAIAIRPDLDLSPGGLAAIRRLVEFTDGLPLALEFAAEWVEVLPPVAFVNCVTTADPAVAITLLRSRSGDGQTRPSLEAAFDRSYRLLTEDERTLLARLSVFDPSADLAAIAEICLPAPADHVLPAMAAGTGTQPALDLLASLAEHSLLQPVDQHDGRPRFRMLRTIRQYARTQLIGLGTEAVLLARHAAYFHQRARLGAQRLNTAAHDSALTEIEIERGNLLAAVAWSRENEPGCATAVGILAAMWQFWYFVGDLDEAMHHFELVLTAVGSEPDAQPEDYSNILLAAGVLAQLRGDNQLAAEYLTRILQAPAAMTDPGRRAVAVTQLAMLARAEGAATARDALAANIEYLRTSGNDNGLAFALAVHAEGLVGGQSAERRARSELAESVDIFERRQNRWGMAFAMRVLADIAYRGRELDSARQLLERSIELFSLDRASRSMVEALEMLAKVAAAQGDDQTAEHAESQRADLCRALDIHLRSDPPSRQRVALLQDHSLSAMLTASVRPGNSPTGLPPGIASTGITAREIEVLELLSQARTNAEIAAELGIGIETVRRHVSNLLMKIGARSRVEAALYAVRNGM
jgi:predicted ATPase/DNA-binding CsgD family transcriptional regulator